MSQYGHLHTNKSWTESLGDLREELRKWDIDDYVLPTHRVCREKGYVEFEFEHRGSWIKPRCARYAPGDFKWMERNIRCIVIAIREARLADQRGIGALFAQVTEHLALPDAGESVPDPYAVLGVKRGERKGEVKAAYNRIVQVVHPDKGGNEEDFIRVQDAYRLVMAECEDE